MNRVVLICVVGLDRQVLGERTPNLSALAAEGGVRSLTPVRPAVTCSAQATMLTGRPPQEHGIVGNGWYNRELAEVRFWQRSAELIKAETVWETMRQRDPSATCANLFWWHNCYGSADHIVNVRPIYRADGGKRGDIWANRPELRDRLTAELGPFPLFRFWGPAADITSSRWIVEAARRIEQWHEPTLSLVYLPHLDYAGQRSGPDSPQMQEAAAEIDAAVGDLIATCRERGVRPLVVSEYGIEPATGAIMINRHLRAGDWLALREECGEPHLDPGLCRAFAVADHQVAHVYVDDEADVSAVADHCRTLDGVGRVWVGPEREAVGLAHDRSGDIVLEAEAGRWFAYPWWNEGETPPDFARTVAIHDKPGYDPCELHLDPNLKWPKAAIGWRLIKKKLGFATLMDVIALDTDLVAGTHGRGEPAEDHRPLLLGAGDGEAMEAAGVRDVVLEALEG